jgi:hypothetical protein
MLSHKPIYETGCGAAEPVPFHNPIYETGCGDAKQLAEERSFHQCSPQKGLLSMKDLRHRWSDVLIRNSIFSASSEAVLKARSEVTGLSP